jgi:hypothetical protein
MQASAGVAMGSPSLHVSILKSPRKFARDTTPATDSTAPAATRRSGSSRAAGARRDSTLYDHLSPLDRLRPPRFDNSAMTRALDG